MEPWIQFVANLAVACITGALIAIFTIAIFKAFRVAKDENLRRNLDTIRKISGSVHMGLKVLIIPLVSILDKFLFYTAPQWLTSITGLVFLMIIGVTSITIGISYEEWLEKRNAPQDKLL